MKGRQNSPTSSTSPPEVMQAFKNFCKRRSKRAMSPRTLDRYEQVIDVLSRKHGLRVNSVDLVDLERIVTERAQVLAPATFNTEMVVLLPLLQSSFYYLNFFSPRVTIPRFILCTCRSHR